MTPAAKGKFLSLYKDWGAYPTGWLDTNGQQNGTGTTYNSDHISVANGSLQILCAAGSDGKGQGAVPYLFEPGTSKAWQRTYGRHESRLRADPVSGYKAAHLMWPANDNWNEGEIDFPEGSFTDGITAFNHWVGDPQSQDEFDTSVNFADWHVYTVEWSPGKVVFMVDGKVIGTSTKHVPSTPMSWVLQTETNIGGTQPKASDSGSVYVDWVTVWTFN